MPGRRTTALSAEATRMNLEQLAKLGGEIRAARVRRRLTQRGLAEKAGVGRMTIGRVERGRGGGVTLDSLQRIALAAWRPLVTRTRRDVDEEPVDGGHLALQELVLRVARASGFGVMAEMPTRAAEPWRSADVALRDARHRRLIIVECWNTFGDVGAALRVSDRKRADAAALAASMWGDDGRAGLVWVVRDVGRNRALIRRYPELFASRFRGSSARWRDALALGAPQPDEPGLLWGDVVRGRIVAWRRHLRG